MIVLLVGEYKTGKSVSAATFPKPLLYFDYDNGFSSAKNARGNDGKLIVPDWNECDVINFHRDGYVNLNFKTASDTDFKMSSAPSYAQLSKKINDNSSTIFNELYHNKGLYNGKQYQTLVIDSLTTLFRLWKENILFMNNIPQLRIQDYMTLEIILFSQYIPSIKSLHQYIPNIILINHEQMDKDELTGRIIEFPVGPSQNMGRSIGREFDEIWRQKVEGDRYIWRTRKDGLLQAGSRLHLPDPIDANYKAIQTYLSTIRKEEVPPITTAVK